MEIKNILKGSIIENNITSSTDSSVKSLKNEIGVYAEDITHLSKYTNRLFGAPFQLLDSVDRRFPEINSNVGNEYLRNFMLNSPILYIRPGMPKYTGNANKTSLSELIKNMYGNVVSQSSEMNLGDAALYTVGSMIFGSGKKLQSRMFGFRETYYSYIQNVNYMCRSVATLMNLVDGTEFPNGCYVGKDVWKTFEKIDWQDYRMTSDGGNSNPSEQLLGYINVLTGNILGSIGASMTISDALNGGLINIFPDDLQEYLMESSSSSVLDQVVSKISSVEFMVQPTQFSESLTNSTSKSMIEQGIENIGQTVGSEIAWISNSKADVGVIDNLVSFLGNGLESVSEAIGPLVEGITGGFTRNLFSGAIASLKGQKMIYPKIYNSSESSMNYEFSVTLTTPYGDPYNYYMNIIVPLLHLIALAAPRMVSSNTISSPFIVQAYIPGMCTCQLGIISNMQIIKNPKGNHVSVNGFPLTVEVKFTIEELYNSLSISPANDPASFLYNETLNDYLCNIAGLAPSLDTYAAQNNAKYQGMSRYFDQGLFAQEWLMPLNEFVENIVTPKK